MKPRNAMSSAGPAVTVLIDTYNYARFVGRAIESALQQEYDGPPIQVLVVDDGSTDNTAAVVDRYGPDVRYIAKDNGGQASALNLGVREAEGDVICLLDGDDYFYPGKVQRVADAFRHRPEVGLVYNEFDIVDGTGNSLHKVYPEPTWTGYRIPPARIPSQLRSLILLGHPWTCITSAMSVRRAVVADLHLPEETFLHSPDLFLGLVLPFLAEVAIIESSQTAYVFHGQNVGLYRSSAVNRSMYQQQMECIRRFAEERFGVHFVRYGGRGLYGPDHAHRIVSESAVSPDLPTDGRRDRPAWRSAMASRCAWDGTARGPSHMNASRRHGIGTAENDDTDRPGGTVRRPFRTTVVSGGWWESARTQWAEFVGEYRQIAGADIEHRIKLRCHAQLLAGVLLPDVLYGALRDVRAKHHRWRNRHLRRRIAEARE